jgi:hypothetical protein
MQLSDGISAFAGTLAANPLRVSRRPNGHTDIIFFALAATAARAAKHFLDKCVS